MASLYNQLASAEIFSGQERRPQDDAWDLSREQKPALEFAKL